ncbi:MAG: hypothetical protein AAFQ21_01240 [Pseudomonadota bacterium]
MSRIRFASGLAALAVLGACATATPYQAASDSARGYENQQIETNRWSVSFSGNSLTDRETVETYLLYRAAELTAQEGFDHFRVVRRETDADSRLVSTGFGPSPFYSGFYCDYRFYGTRGRLHPSAFYRSRGFYRDPFYDPFFSGYDFREVVRYEATAEIIMGRGEKPEDPAFFNAEDVLVNLSGRIQRPEA